MASQMMSALSSQPQISPCLTMHTIWALGISASFSWGFFKEGVAGVHLRTATWHSRLDEKGNPCVVQLDMLICLSA